MRLSEDDIRLKNVIPAGRLKYICNIVDIFKCTMPMLYAKMLGRCVHYAIPM